MEDEPVKWLGLLDNGTGIVARGTNPSGANIDLIRNNFVALRSLVDLRLV